MAYLHDDSCVAHRDLKPANILRRSDEGGTLCVADFDRAEALGDDGLVTGYAGTLRYVSSRSMGRVGCGWCVCGKPHMRGRNGGVCHPICLYRISIHTLTLSDSPLSRLPLLTLSLSHSLTLSLSRSASVTPHQKPCRTSSTRVGTWGDPPTSSHSRC